MKFKLDDFDNSPTEGQLELISDMEEFVREPFTGSTYDDARLYIDRNMEEFKLECMSNWQLSYM